MSQHLAAYHYWMTDNFRTFLDGYRAGLGQWLSCYGIVHCLRIPGSQRTLLSFELPRGLEPHKALDCVANLPIQFEENDVTARQLAWPYGILIEGNRFDFQADQPITDEERAATVDEIILKAIVR